jgi:type IV pilus assembly protein PilC
MIRIGEDSGNLSGTLEHVTVFYDRDVDEAVDSIVAMAEPALTLVAGGMMVWIIGGVFGPLYDSFGSV